MAAAKTLVNFRNGSWQGRWAITEKHLSPITAFFLVVTAYALYKGFFLILGLYRRYLHPLSKFPGPSEACVSTAWAYGEALKGFPEETFEKLHKQYETKALRVGPNELHISDVELYKVIYRQVDPFPKYKPFYMAFNAPHSLFSEVDAAKHKERRRLLNPMFSRAGVLKLEPLIREKLCLLDRKIEKLCRLKEINIYDAFRLLTTDIIMQFAFSESAGIIQENQDNFSSGFTDALSAASRSISLMYEKPWVRHVGNIMPRQIIQFFSPPMGSLFKLLEFAVNSVQHWQASQDDKKESHPIVFDRLSSLTEAEKITEGVDLLAAGSDTTASSATAAVIQILSHPEMERKLVESLDAAIPSAENLPPLLELEKIDYLTACVKECLRFTSAVPGRLPRVVPENGEPFVVDGQVIPPGTIVSMSAHTVHTSVGVWGPDARSFNPDRWLAPNAKSLEQYQVSFSKGYRMCIGQNLATGEITLMLAHFFRKYKMSLPADFIPPSKMDVFTLEYEKPGAPIRVSVRD